jgi:hypothetical protein
MSQKHWSLWLWSSRLCCILVGLKVIQIWYGIKNENNLHRTTSILINPLHFWNILFINKGYKVLIYIGLIHVSNNLTIFILHWFYLSCQIALNVTDQDIAFLILDSCWTMVRNGACLLLVIWQFKNGQSRETGNIDVREYRRGNQQWTIQRNWQHRR